MNTYKAISVPLPPAAKPAESWRLGLFTPPASSVRGSLQTLGRHVCGVWSEPISFLGGRPAKGKGKADKQGPATKQGRVFREWEVGLPRGQGADDVLRIVEQTSFDLDKVRITPFTILSSALTPPRQKIWDSGLALSAWLHAHLSSSTPAHRLISEYLSRLTEAGGVRVIELGAGTGLVSFAIGSAVRRCQTVQGQGTLDIYATDLGTFFASFVVSGLLTLPVQIPRSRSSMRIRC